MPSLYARTAVIGPAEVGFVYPHRSTTGVSEITVTSFFPPMKRTRQRFADHAQRISREFCLTFVLLSVLHTHTHTTCTQRFCISS